ncbi:MAG: hypothetical protein C0513_00115 [Isosphaera sp.]|nr:hypothetical protein [Isosphaera sp.]
MAHPHDASTAEHAPAGPIPGVERVLLIRPSALGDVCRTVPVLAALRLAYPRAKIDWLVRDSFAEAVAHHPGLTSVVPFPRARFARPAAWPELARWLGALRARRYDLVIDAQGLLRSGAFMLATGAPVRVGDGNARELAWLGANRRPRPPRTLHTVERMMALAHAAGAAGHARRDMRLFPPPHATPHVPPQAPDARPPAPFAVLAPTSAWPGKRWPPERFAQLARGVLAARLAEAVVIVGAPAEREQSGPLLRALADEPRALDMVGSTGVGGLMRLIERAALVVACDSAALHIAVGLGVPAVGLYGPTDTRLVGPYPGATGGPCVVVQSPAAAAAVADAGPGLHKRHDQGSRLMAMISVEQALGACEQALAGARAQPLTAAAP